jgi:pimeloyl-ACP methyl ester carboxylesterase
LDRFRACLNFVAGYLICSLALTGTATPATKKDPTGRLPVTVTADQRLEVKTAAGNGVLPLYVSRDWTRPQPDVTRAVLVFHGVRRNADEYLRTAQHALVAAGDAARATLLVTPQFLIDRDVTAHHLPGSVLHWGLKQESWMAGEAAHGPAAISSFEAIDAILARLADRVIFPRLAEVVVAGHSAGGQLVQRYAVVGRGAAALTSAAIGVRYVVAGPSSYLYFSSDRPDSSGGFAPFSSVACPGFNRWKYGWADAPPYARKKTPAAYEQTYAAREVVYLLGTVDTNPNHPSLDKSCAGEAEGPHRYARGLAYVRYMKMRHPNLNHHLMEVPGVAHDGDKMLTSICGLAALFDRPGCAGH